MFAIEGNCRGWLSNRDPESVGRVASLTLSEEVHTIRLHEDGIDAVE